MAGLYVLIGNPVEHSKSPAIHNAIFQHWKIESCYAACKVEKKELATAIRGIRALSIAGANVTHPHKENVMRYLDSRDEHAKVIGAVNTILNKDGKLIGYNTDWTGILEAAGELMQLKGKRVLLIGAGGAAKACAYALSMAGADILITNRTNGKAEGLALRYGGEAIPIGKTDNTDTDMIINATPVGMDGKGMPVPVAAVKRTKAVIDMVYNVRTPLLKLAEKEGKRCTDGKQMLLHQALASSLIWTGKRTGTGVLEGLL